jgi:hypothetical protein
MQKTVLMLDSVWLMVLLAMVVWQSKRREIKRWWKGWRAKPKRTRELKPRSPEDCQDCGLAEAEQGPERVKAREPWSEVKSERGRPKIHDSNGQACMNPRCMYYRETDAAVHALRWDGRRNAGANTRHGWGRRCTG